MDDLKETNQEVWENWLSEEGYCNGCPNHHSDFTPHYGIGSESAEIAIVGEGPRHRNKEDRTSGVPDTHEEKVASSRTIKEAIVQDPDGTKRIPKQFFEKINVSVELDTYFGENIYYTNARRCAGNEETEEAALERCKNYLKPEMDTLEPAVILLLGKRVTEQVSSLYGLDIDDFGEVVRKPQTETRPYIIPTYHWGYTKRSGEHIDHWKRTADVVNQYI